MSEEKFKLDTIESAIRDIRDGKVVIVVDDKNRENEGDLVIPGIKCNSKNINLSLIHI